MNNSDNLYLKMLTKAHKITFIQDLNTNKLSFFVDADINEPQSNINNFFKYIKYSQKNDFNIMFNLMIEKYLKNAKIQELSLSEDKNTKLKTLIINCTNSKKIIFKYSNEYILYKILNMLKEYKDYDFYKIYGINKENIDNIVIMNSEIYSYVSYMKNHKEMEGNNSLYISTSNSNNILLDNDEISSKILNDFYSNNSSNVDALIIDDKNKKMILKFDNNKNIIFYDCSNKYNELIKIFQNDLIDKKIGKVYKKR